MDPVIVVRPYEAADGAFIASLADEAFREYTSRAVAHTLDLVRRFTTLVALEQSYPRTERSWLEPNLSRQEGTPTRVRRVGFVAIGGEPGEDVAQLHAIAVIDRERGRGVGRRLMLAFERLASARRAQRLELCTADSNLAALDLFYKCGFRLLRRRERFYERGQDACILIKDLK